MAYGMPSQLPKHCIMFILMQRIYNKVVGGIMKILLHSVDLAVGLLALAGKLVLFFAYSYCHSRLGWRRKAGINLLKTVLNLN